VKTLEIALGIIALLIWLYLFFARGQFWRVRSLTPTKTGSHSASRIVAVIPARNEAEVIARSVSSLLSVASVQIVLVDDNSTDDTARIAREAATTAGGADRLTVIPGTVLPAGWSGKLWAVHQGINRARELNPDFLLLTDADVVHASDDLNRVVSIAENGPYDLTSLMVRLHCDSFAEKLLVPAFVYFFFKLYPPAFIRDPRQRTAGAAGGCILLRPEALDRAGGIDSIRSEIIDDCALARLMKLSGGSVWLGLANRTSSIRHYDSFGDIGRMISRTAFNQLNHSSLLLAGTLVGLLLTYIAPVALLFSGHALPAALGFIAFALMTTTYTPITRYYRRSPLWSMTLPLAAVFYMGATMQSALKFWLGRGGEWKGRAQDLAHSR
jgi:hopene-associated glycosyltransferase HpnB